MQTNKQPLRDYVGVYLFREEYITPASAARFLRNIADAETEQIEELISRVYGENSGQKDAYSRWGYALMESLRREEALKLFERDREQNRIGWWAELCMAEYAASIGNIGLAQETVKKIYSKYPEAKDGYGRIVWVLVKDKSVVSGYVHSLLMKDVEADRVSPHFMPIFAGILAASDVETSEKLITKAYEEIPSMKNGFARMASHFAVKKDYAEAVKWYEKDDSLGKMTADNRIRYAPVLGWIGRVQDGIANIERAYGEDKNLRDGYSALAESVIHAGDFRLAKELFAKDYEQGRMTAPNKLKYAEYFARFGETERAAEIVESAYADSPKLSDKIVGLISFVPFLKDCDGFFLKRESVAGRLTEAGLSRYLSVVREKTEIYDKLIKISKKCGADACFQWEKIEEAVKRGIKAPSAFEIGKFTLETSSPKTALTEFKAVLNSIFDGGNSTPVIVDCGCGCGVSLAVFLSLYPDGEIIAFEADSAKYDICLRNIEKNGMRGVSLRRGYGYDADGESFARISGESVFLAVCTYSKHADDKKIETVKTYRLSGITDRADFIKITACGTETVVLRDVLNNKIAPKGGCVSYCYDPEGGYNPLSDILSLLEKNLYRYEIKESGYNGGVFWSKDILFKCKEEKMFSSSEPTEIRLINPEFRHYAEAGEDLLNILGMTRAEWEALPFYIRVHSNEFFHLMSRLTIKPKRILEWGTGLSTKIMCGFAGQWGIEQLLTLDDHAVYQAEALGYMNPVPDFLEARCEGQIGDLFPWEDRGYNYATYPLSRGMKFDLIFVDGRRRNECLLTASNCLAEGGLVILHDSWRQRYQAGMGLFEKVDVFDDYTIMKGK